MKIPNGFILYEGPSPLNGEPIAIVLTLTSRNAKTGDMLQTFTILQNDSPLTGVFSGADSAVCGSCPHRGIWDAARQRMINRSCYVDVSKSVQNVWRAYKRGSYPHQAEQPELFWSLIRGRPIRWGAYGEAVLLPRALFEQMCAITKGRTGYTHLWRDPRFAWASPYLAASCDGLLDHREAVAAGWVPYTVVAPGGSPPPGTRQCPATLPDSLVQCRTCLGCSGSSGVPSWTPAHGRGAAHTLRFAT
jgi:hypothetical protein